MFHVGVIFILYSDLYTENSDTFQRKSSSTPFFIFHCDHYEIQPQPFQQDKFLKYNLICLMQTINVFHVGDI